MKKSRRVYEERRSKPFARVIELDANVLENRPAKKIRDECGDQSAFRRFNRRSVQ